VDDAVDGSDNPRCALAALRARLAEPEVSPPDPVLLAWEIVRRQYGISGIYVDQLFEGIAQDLETFRYPSFDALANYCYGVASTVGLMCMQIIGYAGPEAVPYAVRLGVAMQLTNILRDVAEDWRRGRLYLPLEELRAFGLDEQDVAAGRVDDRWRQFMRFQVARVRRLYAEALLGIMLLNPDGRLAVAAAAELYQGILDVIEASGYDVFSRRAHLSDRAKLIRLPRIWWRVRNGGYRRTGGAAAPSQG
jgi:phytoene synthase